MKKMMILTGALCAALTLHAGRVMAAWSEDGTTVCNPMNLPYRFCLKGDDPNQTAYREAADPTMVVFKGEYYLFASKCGAYFHSTDLTHWEAVHTDDLPMEGYAPTVEEMDGMLYFTHSVGTMGVWRTADPKSGKWERVEGAGTPDNLADPMLFNDEGRMYLYYGSSGDPSSYIQGWELDARTLVPLGAPSNLFACAKEVYGWEVPGDYNERKDGNPWLEGAWVNKYNGRYYLQYSAPGTEMKAYCDAVYVADSPLGPYRVQRHNPFAYRPEGFIAAAGHGSTFMDKYGNYWHIASGTVSRRHMFERRLVLYPVFFDADGEMWAYTGFGDFPIVMPQKKIKGPEELFTGWMILSYGKPVTVSSALEGHPAGNAVNEDIRTWWSAETADAGEYITVDLQDVCSVNALQVNFGEQDASVFGEWDGAYCYKLEASADGALWTMLADKSRNAENAPHDYICLDATVKARYVRLTNVSCPTGRFSISGLRVFGTAGKALPGTTGFTTVSRSMQDARTVHLAWRPVEGAVGYNIRYGYAPDKLYLNYTVYGNASLNINSLNANETYYFTIDVFNESGVTKGTEVTEVKAGSVQG